MEIWFGANGIILMIILKLKSDRFGMEILQSLQRRQEK